MCVAADLERALDHGVGVLHDRLRDGGGKRERRKEAGKNSGARTVTQ